MNKLLFHSALKYRVSRHILFFLLVVMVFTLVLYARMGGQHFGELFWLTFLNALIFLGYAYLTVFLLIPLFVPERRYAWFFASFAVLGLLLSALKLSVSDYIFYSSIAPEIIASKGSLSFRFILVNTKDMSFIVALFVVAKFTKDWRIAESQHRALERKYAALNLRLLQTHFEPHFLFNTLNNLYALSLNNPDKTIDVIRRFKRVLQFAISEAQHEKVPLEHEIGMIGDFIEIERIRYGTRLHLKNKLSGDCKDLVIAPFLLFTLVDNCFRHGSSADAGNPWIDIEMQCGGEKIRFDVANSVPHRQAAAAAEEEKGLARLRKRLDLIYPGKYLLEISPEAEKFSVRLELDLNTEH